MHIVHRAHDTDKDDNPELTKGIPLTFLHLFSNDFLLISLLGNTERFRGGCGIG